MTAPPAVHELQMKMIFLISLSQPCFYEHVVLHFYLFYVARYGQRLNFFWIINKDG